MFLFLHILYVSVLCVSGHYSKDRGHPQGEMCVLLRSASVSPEDRWSSLAPPWHGRISCEGEVRTQSSTGRMEVSLWHHNHISITMTQDTFSKCSSLKYCQVYIVWPFRDIGRDFDIARYLYRCVYYVLWDFCCLVWRSRLSVWVLLNPLMVVEKAVLLNYTQQDLCPRIGSLYIFTISSHGPFY